MAITKSDLRVIELVIEKAKAETKGFIEACADPDGKSATLLTGRIDGYSRAYNLIRDEFEEVLK